MKKIAVMIALMLSVMLPGCGKQGTEASADEAVKNAVIIEDWYDFEKNWFYQKYPRLLRFLCLGI